jgi:cytochrome c
MQLIPSIFVKTSISLLLLLFVFPGCGGDSNSDKQTADKSNTSGLPDWEYKNGFGPIKKKLYLLPVDKTMADEGLKIFESKCAACHKLDERYVGPAQRNVLQRISPEFLMNMVLNPEENLEKHPHTKEMLALYMQKMTNQNINLEDARKLLEYFRLLDSELPKK